MRTKIGKHKKQGIANLIVLTDNRELHICRKQYIGTLLALKNYENCMVLNVTTIYQNGESDSN